MFGESVGAVGSWEDSGNSLKLVIFVGVPGVMIERSNRKLPTESNEELSVGLLGQIKSLKVKLIRMNLLLSLGTQCLNSPCDAVDIV